MINIYLEKLKRGSELLFFISCIFLLLLSNSLHANESELVDFNEIKKVIKSDLLDGEVKKKTSKRKQKRAGLVAKKKNRYSIPNEKRFWPFLSEYWLVKNASILKWDFKKVDFGLDVYFKEFLEKFGYYEKRFKILLLDGPNVTHFGLPSNNDEFIILLSLPFIRSMDLSKLEISLIVFEDFIRILLGYPQKRLITSKLKKMIGSNFYGKKWDKEEIEKLLNRYDTFIFDKGYDFQTQYELTMYITKIIKNDPVVFDTYKKLIEKIDNLVKFNPIYDKYVRIYPSPEMQLTWLSK